MTRISLTVLIRERSATKILFKRSFPATAHNLYIHSCQYEKSNAIISEWCNQNELILNGKFFLKQLLLRFGFAVFAKWLITTSKSQKEAR